MTTTRCHLQGLSGGLTYLRAGRHVLKVSDFQILIKSCSIESRNDPSPKSEVVHKTKFSLKISYSTHACLAQLDQHQTCNPVMVSVVSSNPTGGNFFFLDTSMLILYKNARNVRFVLFTKTSITYCSWVIAL